MNCEDYARYIAQKHRLAVALAIIITKPDDETIEEYINRIKSKIIADEMAANVDISINENDFEMSFESNNENSNDEMDRSLDSVTILKDFDETNFDGGFDKADANSFLEFMTQLSNVDKNQTNQISTHNTQNNISQSTFCESENPENNSINILNDIPDDMTYCESYKEGNADEKLSQNVNICNKNTDNNKNEAIYNVNGKINTQNMQIDSQQTVIYTLQDLTNNTHISQSQEDMDVLDKHWLNKYICSNNSKKQNFKNNPLNSTSQPSTSSYVVNNNFEIVNIEHDYGINNVDTLNKNIPSKIVTNSHRKTKKGKSNENKQESCVNLEFDSISQKNNNASRTSRRQKKTADEYLAVFDENNKGFNETSLSHDLNHISQDAQIFCFQNNNFEVINSEKSTQNSDIRFIREENHSFSCQNEFSAYVNSQLEYDSYDISMTKSKEFKNTTNFINERMNFDESDTNLSEANKVNASVFINNGSINAHKLKVGLNDSNPINHFSHTNEVNGKDIFSNVRNIIDDSMNFDDSDNNFSKSNKVNETVLFNNGQNAYKFKIGINNSNSMNNLSQLNEMKVNGKGFVSCAQNFYDDSMNFDDSDISLSKSNKVNETLFINNGSINAHKLKLGLNNSNLINHLSQSDEVNDKDIVSDVRNFIDDSMNFDDSDNNFNKTNKVNETDFFNNESINAHKFKLSYTNEVNNKDFISDVRDIKKDLVSSNTRMEEDIIIDLTKDDTESVSFKGGKEYSSKNNNNVMDEDVFSDNATESQVEMVSFKTLEELNKMKCYLNKRERHFSEGNSQDSGFRSSQPRSSYNSASQYSEGWLNESAHSLLTYMKTCQPSRRTADITDEISKILGKLVDKLHEQEKYPNFIEELLETVGALINDVYEGNNEDFNILIKKDEIIYRLLLLNRSTHVIKYTVEKIVKILQTILDSEDIEITNTDKSENICYIFHILEIILQRIKNTSQSQLSQSSQNEKVLKKSSLTEIWRKKWNLSKSDICEGRKKKCVLTKCSEVLNKVIVQTIDGYSLISFAALQCFNLLQN